MLAPAIDPRPASSHANTNVRASLDHSTLSAELLDSDIDDGHACIALVQPEAGNRSDLPESLVESATNPASGPPVDDAQLGNAVKDGVVQLVIDSRERLFDRQAVEIDLACQARWRGKVQ